MLRENEWENSRKLKNRIVIKCESLRKSNLKFNSRTIITNQITWWSWAQSK